MQEIKKISYRLRKKGMLQSEKVFKNINEWKKEKQWEQVENYQQRKTI